MLTRLEQTIDERTQGILRGLEARVAAFKSPLESMDKAVYDAKQREADQTARYQPYFEAKRDLENQQEIRDAMLLRKLQESVNLQIPPVADWEDQDRSRVHLRYGLGSTGSRMFWRRASARPESWLSGAAGRQEG